MFWHLVRTIVKMAVTCAASLFVGAPTVLADKGLQDLLIQNAGHTQHVMVRANTATPAKTVVFLHGSPGNVHAWQEYLKAGVFDSHLQVIAIDRPGYGKSDPQSPEPSLAKQAQFIHLALKKVAPGQTVTLVGYSYAGAVAARMAVDYPGDIDSLLLIAPALDPVFEEAKWFELLCQEPWLSWLLPSELVTFGKEAKQLQAQLKILEPSLRRVAQPIYYLQGRDDDTVDTRTAVYAVQHFLGTQVEVEIVPGAGHLLPEEQPENVIAAVNKLVGL